MYYPSNTFYMYKLKKELSTIPNPLINNIISSVVLNFIKCIHKLEKKKKKVFCIIYNILYLYLN